MKKLILSLLLLTHFAAAYSQSNPLLSDFGNNGLARINYRVFGSTDIYQDEKPGNIIKLNDGKWLYSYYIYTGVGAGYGVTKFNANGSIDSTFARQGTFFTSPSEGSFLTNIAVQSDGKILLAGNANDYGKITQLVRIDQQGQPDTTFNHTGITNVRIDTSFFPADSIDHAKKIIVKDDKIYVIGTYNYKRVAVVRLNLDGTIDTTYGRKGRVYSIGISSFEDNNGLSVVDGFFLQNGNLALFCSTNLGSANQYAFMQFTPAGTPDTSFNPSGLKLVNTKSDVELVGVLERSDGKVNILSNTISESYVESFSLNGIPDSSFAVNGVYPLALTNGGFLKAKHFHLAADSALIVVGYNRSNYFKSGIIKIKKDGTADNAFGSAGSLISTYQSAAFFSALSTASNTIFIHGTSADGIHLVKVNANGSFDLSFDPNTVKIFPISGSMEELHTMALQSNGAIILGGRLYEEQFRFNGYGNTNWDWLIGRMKPNGSLDSSFGLNGFIRLDVAGTGRHDDLKKIITLPDDRFYVIGNDDKRFTIARYLKDGQLDNTFGSAGFARITSDFPALVQNGCLQRDGKILITGYKGDLNKDVMSIRLNQNGTLDNSFGQAGYVYWTGTNSYDYGRTITELSDGNILVSGISDADLQRTLFVIKYKSNGVIDSSFGINGLVKIKYPTVDPKPNDLQIQADNKILITTTAKKQIFQGGGWNVFNQTIRLHPNGEIDKSFNQSNLNTGNIIETPTTGLLQKDGRILQGVFMGRTLTAVKRYKTSGFADSTFNKTGFWQYIYDQSRNNDIYINDLELQSNNRVYLQFLNDSTVLAASTVLKQLGDFSVFKFKIDNSFPVDSLVITNITKGCLPQISWSSFKENNVSHFEIERGKDSITFYNIGKVNAKNAVPSSSYVYTDTTSNLSGTYYYRVRAVGNVGSWLLSNVRRNVIDSTFPGSIKDFVISSATINGTTVNIASFNIVNQKNIDSVVIERSVNNYTSFVTIGSILPHADSATNAYSFIDSLLVPGAVHWYRIKTYRGVCVAASTIILNAKNEPPITATPSIIGPFFTNLCPSIIDAKASLSNPPLPPVIISIVQNDTINLSFNWADSSFAYRMLYGGTNKLSVRYSTSTELRQKDTTFRNIPNPPQGGVPTRNGNILTAPVSGTLFIWYLNGNVITGANTQSITITQSGNYQYSYRTSTLACYSIISPPLNAVITSVIDPTSNGSVIRIYPNPVPDMLYITALNNNYIFNIQLLDMQGRLVKTVTKNIGSETQKINVSQINAGTYFLKIFNVSKNKLVGIEQIQIVH